MAQLRQDHQKFVEQSAQIVVVGPESASTFAGYFEKEKLPFVGLPDPTHRVLKLFGQEVKIFKLGRMPAQLIIDQQGLVRYVHYGHSMADIPGNEEILSILSDLNR